MTWNQSYAYCANEALSNGFSTGNLAWFPTSASWDAFQPALSAYHGTPLWLGMACGPASVNWWASCTPVQRAGGTCGISEVASLTGIVSIASGPSVCNYIDANLTTIDAINCTDAGSFNVICEFQSIKFKSALRL